MSCGGIYPLAEPIFVPWRPIDRSSGGPGSASIQQLLPSWEEAFSFNKKGSRDKKAALAGRAEMTG